MQNAGFSSSNRAHTCVLVAYHFYVCGWGYVCACEHIYCVLKSTLRFSMCSLLKVPSLLQTCW